MASKIIAGKLLLLFLALLFLVCGCEEVVTETEPAVEPQVSIFWKNYSFENNEFFIAATVTDYQGQETIDLVFLRLYEPVGVGGTLLSETEMNDEGINGDIISFDGVYSSKIISTYPDSVEGFFRFSIIANDIDGNVGEISDSISTVNYPPEVSNLVIPDSIQIHETDTVYFNISLTVVDKNGADDIDIVAYEVSSDFVNYTHDEDWILRDDGETIDQVEGDAIYTGGASIRPKNVGGTTGDFVFRFYAIDYHNTSSDTLYKSFKIYE